MHRDGGNLFDFYAYFARVIAGIFCSGCCKEGLLGLGSREPPRTGMEPPEGDAEAQVPLFFYLKKFFSIILGDQRVLVYRIG